MLLSMVAYIILQLHFILAVFNERRDGWTKRFCILFNKQLFLYEALTIAVICVQKKASNYFNAKRKSKCSWEEHKQIIFNTIMEKKNVWPRPSFNILLALKVNLSLCLIFWEVSSLQMCNLGTELNRTESCSFLSNFFHISVLEMGKRKKTCI